MAKIVKKVWDEARVALVKSDKKSDFETLKKWLSKNKIIFLWCWFFFLAKSGGFLVGAENAGRSLGPCRIPFLIVLAAIFRPF